jgi:hypothetical protein
MVALADGILTKRNLVRQWIHGEKQFLSKLKARNDGDECKESWGREKES